MMLSASHNPMPDNGIKLFARRRAQAARRGRAADRGRAGRRPAALAPPDRRRDRAGCTTCSTGPSTTSSIWSRPTPHPLAGVQVVVDCANGAAFEVAPEVVSRGRRRGHRDQRRAGRPQHQRRLRLDHLDSLRAAVLEHGAHLGIAHDGDADRCLAVDADGERRRRRPDHGDSRGRDARRRRR